MNARSSPGRILADHAENQFAHLIGKNFSADWMSHSGNQFPVQTKTSPMPADYGLGSDDDQRVLPRGPDSVGCHPKQLVDDIQPWPRMPTLEHGELLSQSKIFEQEIAACAKQTDTCAQAKPNDDGEHRSDITQIAGMRSSPKFLILKPSSILARHGAT